MVNADFLDGFEKNIWVVNTSRGQVLVLKDLLDMIDNGKVQGAALDVLEIENLGKFKNTDPITYNRLINHPKILITPHIAGWTHESYLKINEVLVEKISKLRL